MTAKRLLAPIVLAIAGVALAFIAYEVYPRTKEATTPPYVSFNIESTTEVGLISYRVRRGESGFLITISADVYPGTAGYPSADRPASLQLFLPEGVTPQLCPRQSCLKLGNKYSWLQKMTFNGTGTATVTIAVATDVFGYSANGLNASVVMPEAGYRGSGTPELQVHYDIPSANSYDWSSFPTAFVSETHATWTQEIDDGEVAARTAVGVNHARRQRNDLTTFLAGALVGLAGGAIISSVQEALHATD